MVATRCLMALLLLPAASSFHASLSPPSLALRTASCHALHHQRHPGVARARVSGLRMCEEGEGATGPKPDEWRAFRAALISNGIKTTAADEGAPVEQASEAAEDATEGLASSSLQQQQQRAAKNEELLLRQNPQLHLEYMEGGWAHVTPKPEVGGLLARLPIEAQLVHQMSHSSGDWGAKLEARLREQIPVDEGESDAAVQDKMKSWSSNLAYVYKLAQALIKDTFAELNTNPKGITGEMMNLLEQYVQYQDTWQEVVLLLEHDEDLGSKGVIINRPLRTSLSEPRVASLFLFGGEGQDEANDERLFILSFISAFGRDGAVYLGGSEGQNEKGMMIHGIHGLEGAKEISPGTGIYQGGIRAAVRGVLDGQLKPLDFRFFIGTRRWGGEAKEAPVVAALQKGEYQAVACARPLALKQCLGLPKPLWHEVMERCGGRSLELSKLELVRRDDLEEDE